jgi:hypothetical protein
VPHCLAIKPSYISRHLLAPTSTTCWINRQASWPYAKKNTRKYTSTMVSFGLEKHRELKCYSENNLCSSPLVPTTLPDFRSLFVVLSPGRFTWIASSAAFCNHVVLRAAPLIASDRIESEDRNECVHLLKKSNSIKPPLKLSDKNMPR